MPQRPTWKRHLAAGLAGFIIASSAQAGPGPQKTATITLDSLYFAGEDSQWPAYTFLARDMVETLNSSGAKAVDVLDDKLHMAERGPLERSLFLLTLGQVQLRFAWANSLLGHEYAHFQHAHGFGLTEHYFVDSDTGEEFGFAEAWRRAILHGDPGGPATSRDGPNGRDLERDAKEGIRKSTAGLNWQMGYTEDRLRGWLMGDERTVFDAPDFIMNRIYTFAYSLGNLTGASNVDAGHGDPDKFANHLSKEAGVENAIEKVVAVSLLANIMSPALTAMSGSILPYISEGAKDVSPQAHALEQGGAVTWDIPQYFNTGNMSLSPTLYWLPPTETASRLGAERLVIGAALEVGVLGNADAEVRGTLDGTWGRYRLGAGLAIGSEGAYFDGRLGYELAQNLSLSVSAALRSGHTMRADRELPDADKVAWAGLRYRF